MRKLHSYLILFIACLPLTHIAQVSYTQDEDFSIQFPSKSLIAVGIADVNGDKRDDIVRITNGNTLEVLYVADSGEKSIQQTSNINLDDAWSMVVANVDNDMRNEVLVSRAFDDLKIIKSGKDQTLKLHQELPNLAYSQSSTMADINNDGWLDIFICSDDSKSTILRNDGSGKFVKDDTMIDLNTKIESDNSGNYGSEWTDIDSDGDIDLYISKCKAGVTNPNDPRRVNTLYINDGENNYTEKAKEFGLHFGQQSWASAFGDLDNDGDIDGIVIHHEAEHSLLENINNQFIDRSSAIGNLFSYAYQVLMRDFDNNGFQDILVCGDRDYMLWNLGDFKFEVAESPFKHYNMISFATGDLDRDGMLDVLGVYGGTALNAPGVLNDVLWMANENDNHSVSFSLNGTKSNANGIGARISIHGPWGVQVREVKAGESYSISNSLNVHFGLGDETHIDKVEVQWPSGQTDTHSNIPADKFYQLTEASCIVPVKNAVVTSYQLCEGESVSLNSSTPSLWSDGQLSTELSVDQEGVYFYEIEEYGCKSTSASMFVDVVDLSEDVILQESNIMACNDDPFVVHFMDASGQSQSKLIEHAEEGSHQVVLKGNCTSKMSTVSLKRTFVNNPKVMSSSIQQGESVEYSSAGEIWNWYLNEKSVVPFYRGDSIQISNIEESREYFVEAESTIEYESVKGGEYNFKGSTQYASNRIYGGMYFHVKQELIIEELTLYTDTPGERLFEIKDEQENIVFSHLANLESGRNRIVFNAILQPGQNYFIGTNIDKNIESLGHPSPQLVRSNAQTKYPYQLNDLMTIVNSSFGPAYYLYFYDWQVRHTDFICYSDRVSVTITVDNSTAVDEEFTDSEVSIFPNPASQHIQLSYPDQYKLEKGTLLNMQGQKLMDFKSADPLDVSGVSAGLYIIELYFEDRVVKKQLIIVD